MGIDAGFDMVPRLSNASPDKENWQSFMDAIIELYRNDDLVEVKTHCIEFKTGEHPLLPFQGHNFMRFSAKISGSHAGSVEKYIDTVTQVAIRFFGSRIHPFNDVANDGFYSWTEVNDSLELYEQPDEADVTPSIGQNISGTETPGETILPFAVQSIPNKGRGLVARCNITKGTRIICEKPLCTSPNLSPISAMEMYIATKLKSLSKSDQRIFLSLHNNFPGKNPFSRIFKTNALPCGSGSRIGGVYRTICFINHNCLPNAHNSWNNEKECETIHATSDISAGEEITISYVEGQPSDCRRNTLKQKFGFDCNCGLCSLSPTDVQLSDARRIQIQRLDDKIGDPGRLMNRPHDSLADCRDMVQLINEEYRGSGIPLLARLYYDAFQISIAHSDQARASVFAQRAYEMRAVCEGEDSVETQKMKRFMTNPTQHGSFGASRKWRTSKGSVPKSQDGERFEDWLWRQDRGSIRR